MLLACVRLARAAGVTLTAYSDDRIFCDATDAHTDRLLFYKEPPPEGVGDLERIVGKRGIQKASPRGRAVRLRGGACGGAPTAAARRGAGASGPDVAAPSSASPPAPTLLPPPPAVPPQR